MRQTSIKAQWGLRPFPAFLIAAFAKIKEMRTSGQQGGTPKCPCYYWVTPRTWHLNKKHFSFHPHQAPSWVLPVPIAVTLKPSISSHYLCLLNLANPARSPTYRSTSCKAELQKEEKQSRLFWKCCLIPHGIEKGGLEGLNQNAIESEKFSAGKNFSKLEMYFLWKGASSHLIYTRKTPHRGKKSSKIQLLQS